MDYSYKRLFSEDSIPIRSYPIETVLAEKLETITTRSIFNTRPRDFYDVYILSKSVQFDPEILSKALLATSDHRGTKNIIKNEAERRIEKSVAEIPEEIPLRKGYSV